MKKDKRRNTIMLLILLLCGITIGFAILTTTLHINGTGLIKGNKWDIHWDNVDNIDGVTAQPPQIDTAKTTVTYEINLANPGDFYEFTVDAVNDGSLDGVISKITHKYYQSDGETELESLPVYLEYSMTNLDGSAIEKGQRLDAGDSKTYKVRINFKTSLKPEDLPTVATSIVVVDTVDYVQADVDDDEPNITVARRVEGEINPGDVVTIGSYDEDNYPAQDFFVISSDSSKTVMAGRYNLLLGNIVKNYSTVTGQIPTTTPGYGLQSSEASGYISSSPQERYATVSFVDCSGGSCYWKGKVGEGKKYSGAIRWSGDYEAYNSPYPYVYDENSDIYNDVQSYVRILKNNYYLPNNIKGRLLSYEEADASKNVKVDGKSIIFDQHQTYFLGSAYDYHELWTVYADTTSFDVCYDNYTAGLRPVIEIPTKLLK